MALVVTAEYEGLEDVASRFERLLQEVEELSQSVTGTMEPLRQDGWIGRGSDAFFDEMESTVLPAVQRLADAFDQGSRVTRAVAAIFRQAEEEASSPFRSRRR